MLNLIHAHHARHMEDLPFWLRLAATADGPILELGCGTGRLTLPLVEAGFAVTGVERQAEALRFLQGLCPAATRPHLRLVQADFTALPLQAQFALAIMPCNTYSTLLPHERRAALQSIRRVLCPGGVFAASLPNPLALLRLPLHSDPEVEEIFPHPQDGEPVQASSGWRREGRVFAVQWHYDHLLPDGSVERLSATIRHRLEKPAALLAEIEQAGFVPPSIYGDFDFSDYRRASPLWIFTAAAP